MKKGIMIFLFIILSICATVAFAEVAGEAVIVTLVNQDPDPALAGDLVEIRVGIENIGDMATGNYIVELNPKYPFEAVPDEDLIFNVGSLDAYQTGDNRQIVKFKVRVDKDATAGSYSLPVLYYEEGKRDPDSKILFNIDLDSKDSAEIIYIDKTVLIPGKEEVLTFTINNVGSSPLRDLTFSWVNEDKIVLPVGSDNTKYIKYIDVGDSVQLQYHVIADTNADAGLYELTLQLSYEDSATSEETEITTSAGIYVGGGTDFDVAFSESSASQMSFTIANVGSNPATSVSVIVPEQQGWSVTGTNTMIIGNLNTGDYTVASFALQQSSAQAMPTDVSTTGNTQRIQQRNMTQSFSQRTSGSKNNLKMQIAYTDTMGKREIVEKNVTMSSVSSATSATTTTGTQVSNTQFGRARQQSFFAKYQTYIIVLAGLVLLVISIRTYRRYRREKLLNPGYTVKDLFSFSKKKSKSR